MKRKEASSKKTSACRGGKGKGDASADSKKDRSGGRRIVLQRRPCPIQKNEFPDATNIERELLRHGTVKDKIDTLTLLVDRNPSAENYKGLLAFCENQRNDVHYHTLKNIKDLLVSKNGVADTYIKKRIVRSFETNLKNMYIKKKVMGLVSGLLEKGILFIDLIYPFINKLGDKKDVSEHVAEKLHLLMPGNEEVILDSLEDFYFKNDVFRSRHMALQFLSRLDCRDKRKAFRIFNLVLEHLNENIPEEHRNILLEDVIMGLGKNITDEKISRIDVVRRSVQTEKMVFYGCKVLSRIGDPEMLGFLRSAIKSNNMRNSKKLSRFLNMVHSSAKRHRDREFYCFLLEHCLLYTPQYIVSIMIICSEARTLGMRFDNIHGLRILALHHNDVVRKLARQLINDEVISPFDPFDSMSFTSAEMMCEDLSE